MIDQAEACDFPLLELPFEYSLSQISFAVYQEILNRQAALLSNIQGYTQLPYQGQPRRRVSGGNRPNPGGTNW